jgi:integrase
MNTSDFFSEYLGKFEDHLLLLVENEEGSIETYNNYSKSLGFFVEWVGNNLEELKSPTDLNYKLVNKFIKDRSDEIRKIYNKTIVSANTKANYKKAIQSFINFIEEDSDDQYLFEVNWKRVKIPKQVDKLKDYLDDDYVDDLMEYLSNLYIRLARIKDIGKLNKNQRLEIKNEEYPYAINFIFKVAIYAGLRSSEICSLTLNSISKPRRSKGGKRVVLLRFIGKGRKERKVSISFDLIKKEIRYYEKLRAPSEPILRTITGKKINRGNVIKYIKEVGRFVNIDDIYTHLLRHTSGFKMADNDVSLGMAQDQLGHASPNTTRIYYKQSEKQLIEIADKVTS